MLRICAALLVLAACKPPEPPPPAAAAAAPKAEVAPPPPAEPPAAAKSDAAAERRARVAGKAAQTGVLKALGSGSGSSVADVLGNGGDPDSEWPALSGIPVPTTRRFLGAPPAAAKTLGDVARTLDTALEQHGYEEVGYFRYADGFAIATRPERIAGDARPVAANRWPAARVRKAEGPRSLQDLFEVDGAEGDRYRSFLFLCTGASAVDFQGGAEQSWGLWKTGSMNPEDPALLARPVGAHKLYAFVYELSQDKAGKVLIATSSPNTAAEHLRGAGLVSFLR